MSERSERLFAALGAIGERKIDEAAPVVERPARVKGRGRRGWLGAVAAVLAVVVLVGALLRPGGGLTANAPKRDDGSTIQRAAELCGDKVAYIDLRGDLTSAGDFYRTDHHGTTQGAQRAWWKMMAGMGRVQPKEDMDGFSYQGLSYTEVSNSFYGTTYSSSGAAWVRPDTIHTVIPEGGTKGHVTVTGYPEGLPIESSLYHPEKLEVKDKYAYFLGGNQPLCVIQNPDAPDGKLLVIRDSYSDSLAPFLAEEFQEVHLFDLRYNNMSVQQYVADNGIDQVLVLYSVANFSTDMNLFKLAH